MKDTPKILSALLEIDAALAAEGVHPMSPYWRKQITRFYRRPKARMLIECVGRGGDKSRMAVKMAIAETTAGEFDNPKGERHYHTHISENVAEAAKTLGVLEQYLQILGVKHARVGDTIELENQPRGFKVLACRVGAVSGWRCIGWTADECAKWNNEGVDPSAEVVASIRAMTVTHPTACGRIFSSPVGRSGFFFESWARGNTDAQLVGHAPTWIANPSVTEEQTRALEPDERVWRREYAAEAQAGALSAFDVDAIDRAMGRDLELTRAGPAALILDPSSGRKDAWTWAIARWVETPSGVELLKFDVVDALEGRFWKQTTGDKIVAALVGVAKEWSVKEVHADQREALMLEAEFRKSGLRYRIHNWTSASKPAAVERVRRWFQQDQLLLPKHDKLRRELLAFEEKIAPSGQFTFGARGSGHDDFVALLLTAAMADINRQIDTPARAAKRAGPTRKHTFEELFFPGTTIDNASADFASAWYERNNVNPGYGDDLARAISKHVRFQ